MKGSGYKTTVNGKWRPQSRKKRTRACMAGGKKKKQQKKDYCEQEEDEEESPSQHKRYFRAKVKNGLLACCVPECMLSELDIFTFPETQTSIESSSFLHYKPVSSFSDDEDAPIEFVIPCASEHYIDLAHTMLYVKAQIQLME